MLSPLETAQFYFELSNKSNLDTIENLFTETSTYSSQSIGIYLGRDSIMAMQRVFHSNFSSLQWRVNSVEEVKPGITLFNFDFVGETLAGEKVVTSGLEYIIVHQGKIQHIEIRDKLSL